MKRYKQYSDAKRYAKLSRVKRIVNMGQQLYAGNANQQAAEADVLLKLARNKYAINRKYKVNCPQCWLEDQVRRTVCCRPMLRSHLLDHRLAKALGVPHPWHGDPRPGTQLDRNCPACQAWFKAWAAHHPVALDVCLIK